MRRLVDKARALAGDALVRAGLRVMGAVPDKHAPGYGPVDDDDDDDGLQPQPAVVLTDRARAMLDAGNARARQHPAEDATLREAPLRGSIAERVARARGE